MTSTGMALAPALMHEGRDNNTLDDCRVASIVSNIRSIPGVSALFDRRQLPLDALADFDAEQVMHRVLGDMVQAASANQFERRAEVFEWARPRPEDFHGRATPEELAERDRRLMETAAQCRAHALVLRSIAAGGDLGGSLDR